VLDEAIREYIFKEILCNSKKNDFIGLDMNECEVFLCFMAGVNIYNSRLEKIKNTNIYLVDSLELIGMPQLWQIFLNNKQSEVINRTAELICDYNTRLSTKLRAEVGSQLLVKLVKKCIDFIASGSHKQNYRLISNCVMLLLKLIGKTEGRFEFTPSARQQAGGLYDISVINTKTNEKVTISLNYTLPIGCMRRQIGNEFAYPITEFELSTKTGFIIGFDIDYVTYFESGVTQPIYFTPIKPKPNLVKT
jgi:hypothetical protein